MEVSNTINAMNIQATTMHKVPEIHHDNNADNHNMDVMNQQTDVKIAAAENASDSGNTDNQPEHESAAQMEIKALNSLQKTQEQIDAENQKIREAVSEMTKKMSSNTEAVFGIHDGTNRVTIKMVDKNSKKVIKEFPPDKTLDMIAKVWELAGMMVDEKR